MKKILLSVLLGLSTFNSEMAMAQAIARDEKLEKQVEELLSKMTLRDKVGQMCQLTLDVVAQESSNSKVKSNKSVQSLAGGLLSAEAVDNVFGEYKVGSILNIPLGVAQTPKVWSEVVRALNSASAFHCNGVPQIHGIDQIHGASYTYGATLFPQEIGLAASFNRQIPKRVGHITAYETRACLVPWVFSPALDIMRNQLWPRQWESFGEDVLVNKLMGVELTKGLQGDDPNHIGRYNVAACLKHYMAYGTSVSGKDRTPSMITDRELMEKYFQPFRACIEEAGALSIMVSSGINNGMSFHCSRKLLTEWLKEGLNWDGVIVTDWADIDNIWKRDHIAANKKDAICLAVNAGIDMSMEPYDTGFCTLLAELANEGRVPMSRIDDAVRRILRMKIRVGLMDRSTWDIPYSSKSKKQASVERLYPDFACGKYTEDALHIAEECMVLLKNETGTEAKSGEKVLPIKKGTKLLVVGPNADDFRTMNGGWTYTWQGRATDSICRTIGKYHTFLDALRLKYGDENVEYSPMVAYDNENGTWRDDCHVPELLIENGNSTADKIMRSDVIVAFIGENSYTETVGNIDDLTLSQNQIDMVKSLAKYDKPIVLVLNEGRPRIISAIEPLASAVVQTFLPGNYGGDALANLLSGDVNFSAKLPYTYPKHHGALNNYDCKPCENVETMSGAYNYDAQTVAQWPFGYGLSYSDVHISDLKVTEIPRPVSFDPVLGLKYNHSEKIAFTFNVTNNSDCAVKEPVLLYTSDLVASLTPDSRRLRSFKKVALAPHETKSVTLRIRPSDLAFVNEDLQWVLEPGDFRVQVGTETATFTLKP
ncbi:MAG: glycoside hydrolase family 3 C-terminal domain-containing protein [Bacteroidales bacterium]|nr:glycoside hydrolase family 3 C-terminal domain-containing protein [Bacteroidales bacterium]MCM1147066.1 glycoside hydrolase family 3 C-terminal domain-containing protein [Bacteroidales bacterium]MCM1205801.1 glycoside hydrolase family 3 C-terminal domain-containing protein [Bacillota bacterium]MCM1509956.1 glycoside hydrolase family 3 C-terminal domain-containing protein [Clostridium sp.]